MVYVLKNSKKQGMYTVAPNILKKLHRSGGLFMQLKTVYSEFLYDCEVKKFSAKTIKGYRNKIK